MLLGGGGHRKTHWRQSVWQYRESCVWSYRSCMQVGSSTGIHMDLIVLSENNCYIYLDDFIVFGGPLVILVPGDF